MLNGPSTSSVMNILKLFPVGFLALILCAGSLAHGAVLTDFDSVNLIGFGPQGGATLATGNFYSSPGNELQFTTGTGVFLNYAGAFFGRGDSAVGIILASTQITFNYYALAADMPQAARIRFVVNSDAWASGGNYHTFNFVDLPSSADSNGLFTFDYSAIPGVVTTLSNYQSGGGSYFGIGIDNGGFPTINTSVKFGIDNVQAVPEPSSWVTLLSSIMLFSLACRRSGYPSKLETGFDQLRTPA